MAVEGFPGYGYCVQNPYCDFRLLTSRCPDEWTGDLQAFWAIAAVMFFSCFGLELLLVGQTCRAKPRLCLKPKISHVRGVRKSKTDSSNEGWNAMQKCNLFFMFGYLGWAIHSTAHLVGVSGGPEMHTVLSDFTWASCAWFILGCMQIMMALSGTVDALDNIAEEISAMNRYKVPVILRVLCGFYAVAPLIRQACPLSAHDALFKVQQTDEALALGILAVCFGYIMLQLRNKTKKFGSAMFNINAFAFLLGGTCFIFVFIDGGLAFVDPYTRCAAEWVWPFYGFYVFFLGGFVVMSMIGSWVVRSRKNTNAGASKNKSTRGLRSASGAAPGANAGNGALSTGKSVHIQIASQGGAANALKASRAPPTVPLPGKSDLSTIIGQRG